MADRTGISGGNRSLLLISLCMSEEVCIFIVFVCMCCFVMIGDFGWLGLIFVCLLFRVEMVLRFCINCDSCVCFGMAVLSRIAECDGIFEICILNLFVCFVC